MNGLRSRRARRGLAFASVGLVIGLPLIAYFAAPVARADDSPGANLAGLNANAYATGVQFIPLVKGLVPAGNLATGDFFQISVPYAGASSQTGPASSATGTPVYPGPVATTLPGALQTEGFPAQLAALTADPALAQAAFPPQPGQGPTGSYVPPAGSTTGAGTAQASANEGGSKAEANLTDTPLAGGNIVIGSSKSNSATTIAASSVTSVAHADLSHISILGGTVDIASVSSDATASSDGNNGTNDTALKIGAVTVAGQPAYIGPDGLHLAKTSNDLGGLTNTFNSALTALQQAGISISTIAPTSTTQGAVASVDSGAVQIHFVDPNIPNPQGNVPVTSIGTDIDLGLTHADAQATVLPPFSPLPPLGGSVTPLTPAAGTGSGAVTAPGGGIGQPNLYNNNVNLGTGGTTTAEPLVTAGAPSAGNGGQQQAVTMPASFIGMPTRMAWVVIAVILSIVASGPLLAYANWQLLRGRRA